MEVEVLDRKPTIEERILEQTNLVQTFDRDEADLVLRAYEEIGRQWYLKTEQEIVDDAVNEIQERYWFLQPEYIDKIPREQWTLQVDRHTVELFNYTEEVINQKQLMQITFAMAEFEVHFPGYLKKLRHITIVDWLPETLLNDPASFPTHAEAQPSAGMFALTPYALEPESNYRQILDVPVLCAVVTHELAHFGLGEELGEEWEAAGFMWKYRGNNGLRDVYAAKQPNKCVTPFGQFDREDDVCESVVAYLYDRKKLDGPKAKAARIQLRDRTIGERWQK